MNIKSSPLNLPIHINTPERYLGRRRNNCNSKKRYANKAEATKTANQLENNYLITKFIVYKCANHQCWHVAHQSDYVGQKNRQMQTDYAKILNLFSASREGNSAA